MRTAAGYSPCEKAMLFSGTAKARLSPRAVSIHFRNRQRCGVPNPQNRQRELDLWLLLFQGADAGMGLEGALLPPARHTGIPELRRRQVRPTPGHTVPQHGRGCALG